VIQIKHKITGEVLKEVDADTLRFADLRFAIGNSKEVQTIQTSTYHINIFSDKIQIGCEVHKIKDWFEFSDSQIIEMDGKDALIWWRKWKPILKLIVELR